MAAVREAPKTVAVTAFPSYAPAHEDLAVRASKTLCFILNYFYPCLIEGGG